MFSKSTVLRGWVNAVGDESGQVDVVRGEGESDGWERLREDDAVDVDCRLDAGVLCAETEGKICVEERWCWLRLEVGEECGFGAGLSCEEGDQCVMDGSWNVGIVCNHEIEISNRLVVSDRSVLSESGFIVAEKCWDHSLRFDIASSGEHVHEI